MTERRNTHRVHCWHPGAQASGLRYSGCCRCGGVLVEPDGIEREEKSHGLLLGVQEAVDRGARACLALAAPSLRPCVATARYCDHCSRGPCICGKVTHLGLLCVPCARDRLLREARGPGR